MADLAEIKLPDNSVYTLKDSIARWPTSVIYGSQTAATGAWKGIAPFSELKSGQSILYWLPYAGSGNATLNLTLTEETGDNLFDPTDTSIIKAYYIGSTTDTYLAGTNARSAIIPCNANTTYIIKCIQVAALRVAYSTSISPVSRETLYGVVRQNYGGDTLAITTGADAVSLVVNYYLAQTIATEEEVRNSLTIKEGASSTTGAINCYYSGTTRLTTHYVAGSTIRLTYLEGVAIAGSSTLYTGWWADANYDTNTLVNPEATYMASKTGSIGLWAGGLAMRAGDGTYQSICTASDGTATASNRTTATTKLANTNGFEVGSPVWYANSNVNPNTNITAQSALYTNYSTFDSRYSFNTTLTAGSLTAYSLVYLVGTIDSSDGLFYLDSIWWTQTPDDTSKVYILVGGCYDSTTSNCRIVLNDTNTWYKYDGVKLVPLMGEFEKNTNILADKYVSFWDQGGLTTKGVEVASTVTIRSNYIAVDSYSSVRVNVPSAYRYSLNWYDASGTFVRTDRWLTGETITPVPSDATQLRACLSSVGETMDVAPADYVKISLQGNSYVTDPVSKSGDVLTGDIWMNQTGSTNSLRLRETTDGRGAMYVMGPEGCGTSMWYANNNGSSEIDFKNADGANRVGMYISTADEGVVYVKDTNNDLATITKSDVDRWNSNSRVHLWTNATPSSGMTATTISLPSGTSSKYSRLLVEFVSTGYSPWLYTTAYVLVGTESFATGNITSTASLYSIYRSVTYSSTDTLQINAGYRLRVNASTFEAAAVNDILVPLDVWGIPDTIETGTVNPSTLINVIYPIGSIYTSVNNVDPGTFLAGTTWERIQDTFLLASGSTYAAGTTGGEAEHTLTTNEIPSHNHTTSDGNWVYTNGTDIRWLTANTSGSYALAWRGLTTDNTGGGAAHNNMPPYLTVYMWKRTA